MRFKTVGCLLLASLFFCTSLSAAYIIKNGKIYDADEVATLSVEEHFELGCEAYNQKDWHEAIRQFSVITCSYPNTSYGKDSFFYLGVAYYYTDDCEFANQALSKYIQSQNNPKYFEEAIQYKFAVAEAFKEGARRRIFGSKRMPKWLRGYHIAIETYNEVIAAVPCHEIAAQALFSKGDLLWTMGDYREAVEAYQTLIRRFPKHELAPVSYLTINQIYLDQAKKEFQNPDILALAQLNLKKFHKDFPTEERLKEAEQNVLEIKEVYARGLFETGQFYERVQQPMASIIYYQSALKQFPETSVAKQCIERLGALEGQSSDQSS